MRNRTWLVLIIAVILTSGCAALKSGKKLDPDATVEQLHDRAQKSLDGGNWSQAIQRMRDLEGKYPYGVYAEQAQLNTVYAYYKNKEPGLAIAAADRFIKLNPTHESVDYAYYLKGLSSFEEDQSNLGYLLGKDDLSDRDPTLTQNALNAFRDVYTLFPDSRYAARARERVAYLTNAIARHEIAIATYYFSREAHVAVVNRAKGVVENYPTTASVEMALALLMQSYKAMNLPELASDSRRVLELNFPDSRFLDSDAKISGRWYSQSARKKRKNPFTSLRNIFKKTPTT